MGAACINLCLWQGISQLELLEVKVENASTIPMKEKYRTDMKRELKKLQRLRDIFRQNVNNPAVLEQHKLVEARRRIELVSPPHQTWLPFPQGLAKESLCLVFSCADADRDGV